jgi:hypothetical protein
MSYYSTVNCVLIYNRSNIRDGLFKVPIPSSELDQYPIIQYANNIILIMEASQHELFTLKGSLESFSQSTGVTALIRGVGVGVWAAVTGGRQLGLGGGS